MRRFVGAAAFALALSVISVGTRGDTVDLQSKPADSVTVESAPTPSPYQIKSPDEVPPPVHAPAQHEDPQSVPLPGAAWAGIAMMASLLIGRHMIRRRRRLV